MLQARFTSEKTFLNSSPSKEDTGLFCREKPDLRAGGPGGHLSNYGMEFSSTGERLEALKKLKTPTCRFFKAWVAWGSFWGLQVGCCDRRNLLKEKELP